MKISVVMAVHNGRKFLAQQIESILSQLEPGDELVAVDDASSDGSGTLLTALNSPCIRVHSNAVNQGVKAAFERGLALAGGEAIFLSDQDDIWLPGKRAAFVAAFERDPGALVVISDAEIIDADGRLIAPSLMAIRGGFSGDVLATLWRNRYTGCTMAIRRTLLDVALPIPGAAPMHDMWLGALGALRGRVVYLPTAYLRYRRHGTNETPLRSLGHWPDLIRWRVGLLVSLIRRSFDVAARRKR
jgi:glycosyltransferase involved in cell wall biosynthesis